MLDDPRRAVLRHFAADSLAIETFAYLDTYDFAESLALRQELLLDIYRRLEEADIAVAFPTRTLYLRSDAQDTGQES